MKKTLMVLLLVPALALAQGLRHPKGMPDGKGFGRGRAIEELKLSDDQKKEFAKLRAEHQKKVITMRSNVDLARVDLRQLFAEETPDRKKVEDKTREIAKIETDIKLARTGFWFDVNKMLTPEQKILWKKMPAMMGRGRGPAMWNMHGERGMRMHGDDEDEEESGERGMD